MKTVKITLRNLFKLCLMEEKSYDEYVENKKEIYVKTPENDWVKINGFIKKHDEKLLVEFESGKFFICGSKHIVPTKKGFQFIFEATEVYNTKSEKYELIKTKTVVENFGEVYDISIPYPHLYVTPNGFVHHNTSIARALCEEVGCDYIIINGSDENGIDTLRNKITNYATSVSLSGGRKVVILDEAEYITPNAQAALRNAIESFSNNCSFIFTCNFKNKLIEPLHSRCSVIDFKLTKSDKQKLIPQFFKRVCSILDKENVTYNKEVVAQVVAKYYPDNRRVLNELQRYSVTGNIDTGVLVNTSDINISQLSKLLKEKNFKEVRKWLSDNEDLDSQSLYRKLFDNMYELIKPNTIPHFVILLAKYQYQTAFVADQQINTLALFTEMMVDLEFN